MIGPAIAGPIRILRSRRTRRTSKLSASALLFLSLGGIILGQRALIARGFTILGVGVYAIGAIALVAIAWPHLAFVTNAIPAQLPTIADRPIPPALLLASIASSAMAFGRSWLRGGSQSTVDIAAYWLIGMVLLLIAGAWGWSPPRSLAGFGQHIRAWPWQIPVAGIAIVVIAAIARVSLLDRFPTIVDSDEGFFLLAARRAFLGEMPNPFTTGAFSLPEMYRACSGWLARPFGDHLASYRLFSAFSGIASVAICWRLARRYFGDAIGLASAGFLCFMPLHLWASRSGLNNIFDAFALPLALLMLDRAITRHTRLDAILCGMALGIGIYGYWGSRLFPVIAGIIALMAVLLPGPRLPAHHFLRIGLWVILGFFSAIAPLLGYYGTHQNLVFDRVEIVAGGGTTSPSILDRLEKFPDAVVYPFIDQIYRYAGSVSGGFYRFGPPFLGWTLAPFVAIGGITWIAWFILGFADRRGNKPRPAALLIAWFMLALTIGQTEGMASQRHLAETCVWAAAAGTGLIVTVLALATLVPHKPWHLWLVGGAAVVFVGGANAHAFFSEGQQIHDYGEVRTTATYDIAWRFQQMPAYPDFFLDESHAISYGGFGNWQFLNPGLKPHILASLPDLSLGAPALLDDQLLIVSGEAPRTDLCAIQTGNPDALIAEARNRYGTLLYLVYSTWPTIVLPLAESPAQTTLVPIPPYACGAPQGGTRPSSEAVSFAPGSSRSATTARQPGLE